MKKHFAKLKALSLIEWQLLVASSILLPLTALSLRLFGLKGTQQIMNHFTLNTPRSSFKEEQILQDGKMVAHMVAAAAHHSFYRANCLKQSLVLDWLLHQRGIDSNLHIGVKKENLELNAHAWVEMNGTVLIDDENSIQNFCALN